MDKKLEAAARAYHALPQPGKIEVRPTKSHNTQQDLTLAYSPGMAVLCKDIEANPELAYDYSAKGNLVAVISNGTAVLGLGNIGAMAGKGLLFKQIKQNFPLKYFYGESANAIKLQIWITLIANLLLMILKRGLMRSWSFSGLATMVRIVLMYYVDFYSLFNHPEKDWKMLLNQSSKSPPIASLFDQGGLESKIESSTDSILRLSPPWYALSDFYRTAINSYEGKQWGE